VKGLDDDEVEFDFFGEPETAETVERGWRRSPLQSSGRWSGGEGPGRRQPLPPGLVGIGRLAGVVTAVIVAVVALVSGLGACQGAGADYAGYLKEVGALAQSSDQVGVELASDLRSTTLSRPDLAKRLQDLAAQEQQAYDHAQQIRPPGPLRQVHGELLAALDLRATGLAGLGQVLVQTGSGGTVAASFAKTLAAQALLLTTSDIVWNELYRIPADEELRARRFTGLVAAQSRIVPNPASVSAVAFTLLLQHRHQATTGSSTVLLKPGVSGTAVAAWQKQLNRWLRTQPGQPLLPVDGAFGALTTAATKALQHAAGITADGIVGPTTRQALIHQLARIK
jgi:peptidoglycan hydrolase-like protein with peptidoglycan-binding domain